MNHEKEKSKNECPLDSEIGRNWHTRTRSLLINPGSSDSEKAELCRRLAADSHLRSLAFKSHGESAKELAARFVLHRSLGLTRFGGRHN